MIDKPWLLVPALVAVPLGVILAVYLRRTSEKNRRAIIFFILGYSAYGIIELLARLIAELPSK